MDATRTEHSKDSKNTEEPRNWTQYFRAQRRRIIECPECHDKILDGYSFSAFYMHFAAFHATSLDEKTTDKVKINWLPLLFREAIKQSGGNKRYGYPLTRRAESR